MFLSVMSGASSFALSSIDIRRVDPQGHVVILKPEMKNKWSFENPFCQQVEIQDSGLSSAQSNQWSSEEIQNTQVSVQGSKISLCLKENEAEFTLTTTQNGAKTFYHYFVETEHAESVIIQQKCGEESIVVTARVAKSTPMIGIKCSSSTQGTEIEVLSRNKKIKSETDFVIPHGGQKQIQIFDLKSHNLGSIQFVSRIPVRVTTKAVKRVVSKDGVVSFELTLGGSTATEKMQFSDTPASDLSLSFFRPEITAFTRGLFTPLDSYYYDVHAAINGISSSNMILEYGTTLLYPVMKRPTVIAFAGLGFYGLSMQNTSGYGGSQTIALELEYQLEEIRQAWGIRAAFAPLGKSAFSLSGYKFGLNGFWSIQGQGIYQHLFIQADLNLVHILPAAISANVVYSSLRTGLSIGYRFGENHL